MAKPVKHCLGRCGILRFVNGIPRIGDGWPGKAKSHPPTPEEAARRPKRRKK